MTEPRTPLPWRPSTILHLALAEDIDFAVRACNSHDEMAAALEKAKRELDADLECLFCYSPKDSHVDDCPAPLIEAALAKAKKAP